MTSINASGEVREQGNRKAMQAWVTQQWCDPATYPALMEMGVNNNITHFELHMQIWSSKVLSSFCVHDMCRLQRDV